MVYIQSSGMGIGDGGLEENFLMNDKTVVVKCLCATIGAIDVMAIVLVVVFSMF